MSEAALRRRLAGGRRGAPTGAVLGALLCAGLASGARAAPALTILDLPFSVSALRGPGSEVAVSAATSGLLPLARPRPDRARDGRRDASDADGEAHAPLVVVWGPQGGAALDLAGESLRTTLFGAEAAEGLAAAETPRGAVPGTRRALAGPVSAYLTGPTRAGGRPGAAGLTLRERQPLAVSTEPRAVPMATATVAPGGEAAFALGRPQALSLHGRIAFAAATLDGPDASGLVLVGRRAAGEAWTILARGPRLDGTPTKVVAAADFAGGGVQAATVTGAGTLRLWTLRPDAVVPAATAEGYAAGEPAVDLAAVLLPERPGAAELALPTADGRALAVLDLKDGALRERLRIALPAPAATGVAALGRGARARLVVGLADGRVAVVSPEGSPAPGTKP